MRPIPYGRQQILEEDIEAVVNVLRSDYLTQGPKVQEFEEAFAAYIGCRYAVAVANGTAALHLSTLALGVEKNARVLTTPITFSASSNCVLYCGGTPEFVDIDSRTFTIDLDLVEKKLSESSDNYYQGIIPIDFAGMPVDLERLKQIAQKYNLWILEDACHAPGAHFDTKTGARHYCGDGSLADLAIFSFHPVKHIATGEGGMITTNSEQLYEKLKVLRTHGITKDPLRMEKNDGGWYYEMVELGFNYRLSDIQSALGISQLRRATSNLELRRTLAARYNKAFEDLPLTVQFQGEGHAYHLYVILVDRRKELYELLKSKGIFSQVHYIPVHLLPFYQKMGWKLGDFPKAEYYYERCLSLPLFPQLSFSEQDLVIECVRSHYDS